MNCCDEYGDCRQGRDCPARTGTVLPDQARHFCQVSKIKATRPAWMDGRVNSVPPEAGNFQILDLGPDDDGQPLNHDETMALVRTLLLWLLGVLGTMVVASVAVGYGTEVFADLIWTYLAALS